MTTGSHSSEQPTKDEQLTRAAHKAVTDFVNAQNCQTQHDVEMALVALGLMASDALDLVLNGKMEKLS